jgi:hypothetical protein
VGDVKPTLPGPSLELPVDLDGDGKVTFGDLYSFNYWLALGGDLKEAIQGAVIVDGGIVDLSSFFSSPDAALSADSPLHEVHLSGESTAGGGGVILGGAGGCSTSARIGDGSVNLADAQKVLNWLFLGGTVPQCLDGADANDDSEIAISDPRFVLDYLFDGGPPPPAPGPTVCGRDPTPDLLGCLQSLGAGCPIP